MITITPAHTHAKNQIKTKQSHQLVLLPPGMLLIHPEVFDFPGEEGEFFEGAFEFGVFPV